MPKYPFHRPRLSRIAVASAIPIPCTSLERLTHQLRRRVARLAKVRASHAHRDHRERAVRAGDNIRQEVAKLALAPRQYSERVLDAPLQGNVGPKTGLNGVLVVRDGARERAWGRGVGVGG